MVNDYNRMLRKITHLEQCNAWLIIGKTPVALCQETTYWLMVVKL
jgi:hypothetical protein